MSEQHEVEQQTDQPELNGQDHGRSQTATTEPVVTEQPKARSGYGRLRNRHHRLIEEHQNLEAEFQVMRQELAEWRSMYLELQKDLAPLIEANQK